MFEAEEAMIDRVLAQVTEVLEQAGLVVGADRADMNRTAVAQHLVRRVVARFSREFIRTAGHRAPQPGMAASAARAFSGRAEARSCTHPSIRRRAVRYTV